MIASATSSVILLIVAYEVPTFFIGSYIRSTGLPAKCYILLVS